MKGDRFPENTMARRILCKHGIDPYTGCENLAITKNHCHSAAYAKWVLKQLTKADPQGYSVVVERLAQLAIDHDRCSFVGATTDGIVVTVHGCNWLNFFWRIWYSPAMDDKDGIIAELRALVADLAARLKPGGADCGAGIGLGQGEEGFHARRPSRLPVTSPNQSPRKNRADAKSRSRAGNRDTNGNFANRCRRSVWMKPSIM